MTLSDKLPVGPNAGRISQPAPALARFLSDSALSRAALAACGFPVALSDASAKGRPFTYVNPAFESFFGYRADEVVGRPAITLLFPEDESAASMFEEAPVRLQLWVASFVSSGCLKLQLSASLSDHGAFFSGARLADRHS